VERGLNSSRALSVTEMALDPKVKVELVKHILYLEECVFGLTVGDMRRLSFQIAQASFKLCPLCSQSPLLAGAEEAAAAAHQGTTGSRVRSSGFV
jgi:hypothetical protein